MDIQKDQSNNFHESQITVYWQRFLSGDSHFFGQIIEFHYQTLFQYGMKMHPSTPLIEDCIQDMFTDLLKKREKLRHDVHVKSYLLKSLRHKILRQLQQQKSIREHMTLFGRSQESPFNAEFSVETTIIDAEEVWQRKNRLQKCLRTLSPRQQEIIYLRYFQGLECEQVAVIMNLHLAAVYNLSSLALKRLKTQWQSFLTIIASLPGLF